MESQQKKKTGKGSPSGKVWLAGAGPGDAGDRTEYPGTKMTGIQAG